MQNSSSSNGPFGGRDVTAPDGSPVRPQTTDKRPVTAAGSDSVAAKPNIGDGSNAASDQQGQSQVSSGKTAKPVTRRPEPPSARDDAALDKAGHDPAQRILAKS